MLNEVQETKIMITCLWGTEMLHICNGFGLRTTGKSLFSILKRFNISHNKYSVWDCGTSPLKAWQYVVKHHHVENTFHDAKSVTAWQEGQVESKFR